MTMDRLFQYLLVWSAVGFVAFSVYVIVVFRTGLVYTSRKPDGTLKARIPLSGVINMLALLLIIVGFQVVANYFGIVRKRTEISFTSLWLLNYGHYLILFLFDTIVIDGLVLAVWRPGFLRLSDEMGAQSMKKHVLISIPVGIVAGIALTAISTAVSFYALLSS